MSEYTLHHGDCLDILPTLEAQSVDAVICDPPYAEIDRPYGRLTEAQWFDLMRPMVLETRRILKPHGSAVFILQPNSDRVGSMRGWVWRFMAWCVEEWNVIQDVYWWNTTPLPTVHAHRENGLMRGALKYCIWLGDSSCYRDQQAILLPINSITRKGAVTASANLHYTPSAKGMRSRRAYATAMARGGSTPMNVLAMPNVDSQSAFDTYGHGARTPFNLVDWWLNYITKPGDVVADWCMGSGTTGHACGNLDRRFIGIELDANYYAIAQERIATAYAPLRLMQVAV